MVDKTSEIPLKDAKNSEEIDKILQEKLGIKLIECAQAISDSLSARAEELIPDMINMAPYGNYDQMTEDPEVMLKFLKEEAVKVENGELQFIDSKETVMELCFFNNSVDDGDVLKGFVFLGVSGKIRHAFAQVHS